MIELAENHIQLFNPPRDIPTALTRAEAKALYGFAVDKNVLELGSLLGYSTIIMAQSAKKVYAVDPHEGYPVDDPRPTLDAFLDNLARRGVRDRVVPILCKGQEIASMFAPGHFGLIFIDITRSAAELIYMAHDLDPEVIAIHDYGIPVWEGATIAVRNYAKRTGRDFRLVDTLAIFERTKDQEYRNYIESQLA